MGLCIEKMVKVNALVGKTLDPRNWSGNICDGPEMKISIPGFSPNTFHCTFYMSLDGQTPQVLKRKCGIRKRRKSLGWPLRPERRIPRTVF